MVSQFLTPGLFSRIPGYKNLKKEDKDLVLEKLGKGDK